jgi:predicted ester cyclase
MGLTRDELVARLIKAGELEVLGGDQVETDSYFDTEQFRFHEPGSFEADYGGLTNYFKSIRGAFDDRSIRRGIIFVEGKYVACQTWIEGQFVREFTQSPAGPLPPNGERVVWDLSNIFRFDDEGRLVEEWVWTDYRSFLRQLGADGGRSHPSHPAPSVRFSPLGIEHMAYKATHRPALNAIGGLKDTVRDIQKAN